MGSIAVKVSGWHGDDGAIVRALDNSVGIEIGCTFNASLSPSIKAPRPKGFAYHRNDGLRLSGTVLLKNIQLGEDKTQLIAGEIDIISRRERDCLVLVETAAYTHLTCPAKGTKVIHEAIVLFDGNAIAQTSLQQCLINAEDHLTDPCMLGNAGLFFTGLNRENKILEYETDLDSARDPVEIISNMVRKRPQNIIEAARTSGTKRPPWVMAPICRLGISKEHNSRLSAQYHNYKYMSNGHRQWTFGDLVLVNYGQGWELASALPLDRSKAARPYYEYKLL
ncbi:hypothetical protein [Flexibacterium corallicola]|uniref:hypothetical protein n=1 Tax=Flexibacterium corallicola TaxID=3037259 RepID=UPI00286F244C|nr:hypothetical protein [Pseudovibrio sp. M1P-2-3]